MCDIILYKTDNEDGDTTETGTERNTRGPETGTTRDGDKDGKGAGRDEDGGDKTRTDGDKTRTGGTGARRGTEEELYTRSLKNGAHMGRWWAVPLATWAV